MTRAYVPRGTCPECEYRFPLRVDGTMAKHRDPRISREIVTCGGTGWPAKWAEHNRQAQELARGDGQ